MLNKEEQEYGNNYINYCVIQRGFQDLITFAFADDTGKRVILKEYLTTIVKPITDNDLNVYEEKVTALTEEKTAIDIYINS